MKIAVTSQNRRDITEHAGRCRNFWMFDVDDGQITGRSLLELPKEASLHDSSPHAAHPLDGVDLLIAGGMGEGLQARLARKGIEAVVTTERDPERAVLMWLAASLPRAAPHSHAHGQDHGLAHEHEGGCGGCGCS
ncbi:MAG: nitrogen fixation protein [Proteobacteria bacterium]|nr:nitrogen fixation protein [Pseudomonadota bacterium]